MDATAGPARLFFVLLAGALPPVGALAALFALAPRAVERSGTWPLVVTVALLGTAWTGIVAVALTQRLWPSSGSAADLAAGARAPGDPADPLAPLATALAERNRQIGLLASRARTGPHAESVRGSIHHVVATARLVTGDDLWSVAVLSSDQDDVPPGIYGSDPDARPEELSDAHRWLATAEGDAAARGVRHVVGPWGAFVAVDVLTTPALSAKLIAPREGRPAPVGGERDLLALVGEHAAAVIENSLLLNRVTQQALDLERLTTVQRDFLRGVTHDLQAPLTSIRALASEARASAPGVATRDDLDAISHQADRLGRMVTQLLAMSRLEAGVLEPRQEVFHPDAIVRRAWHALRADRPFTLAVTGTDHLAVGDPDRFEQVIWAVLDNAVRYSAPGSEIAVEIRGEGAVSRLTVRDQGIGMSADELRRAFDRFYRSAAARSVAPNGSGIGLHTADGLMRAMGGSIDIDSGGAGHGVAVTLTLPAEERGSADR